MEPTDDELSKDDSYDSQRLIIVEPIDGSFLDSTIRGHSEDESCKSHQVDIIEPKYVHPLVDESHLLDIIKSTISGGLRDQSNNALRSNVPDSTIGDPSHDKTNDIYVLESSVSQASREVSHDILKKIVEIPSSSNDSSLDEALHIGELQPSGGELQSSGGELQPSGGELQSSGGELQPSGGELQSSGGESPENESREKLRLFDTPSRSGDLSPFVESENSYYSLNDENDDDICSTIELIVEGNEHVEVNEHVEGNEHVEENEYVEGKVHKVVISYEQMDVTQDSSPTSTRETDNNAVTGTAGATTTLCEYNSEAFNQFGNCNQYSSSNSQDSNDNRNPLIKSLISIDNPIVSADNAPIDKVLNIKSNFSQATLPYDLTITPISKTNKSKLDSYKVTPKKIIAKHSREINNIDMDYQLRCNNRIRNVSKPTKTFRKVTLSPHLHNEYVGNYTDTATRRSVCISSLQHSHKSRIKEIYNRSIDIRDTFEDSINSDTSKKPCHKSYETGHKIEIGENMPNLYVKILRSSCNIVSFANKAGFIRTHETNLSQEMLQMRFSQKLFFWKVKYGVSPNNIIISVDLLTGKRTITDIKLVILYNSFVISI